jgi:hypothetical protein
MSTSVRPLGLRCFRSNPELEAVSIERVAPQSRAALVSAAGEFEFNGVLRSKRSGQDVKAIDQDTAILFHSFADPSVLSDYLARLLGPDRDTILARLIYDRVLQIQRQDGAFVDGIHAHPELYVDDPSGGCEVANHPISRQSHDAILYASQIRFLSGAALRGRLYQYNAVPQTAPWETLLPNRAATSRWLGLNSRTKWRVRLRQDYIQQRSRAKRDPWLRWQHRGAGPQGELRHKIYVSPTPRHLPAVFSQAVAVSCAMGVPAFKVGGDLHGVLRPDKIVLYLGGDDARWSVARELALALTEFDAQGVPFSAPIDAAGLLSWGTDPSANRTVGFKGGCSWRTFIVDRLASSLTSAVDQGCEEMLIEFALQRLRLEGIEPDGWRPAAGW